MQHVIAEVVETGYTFQSPVDITNVRFEWGELAVTLMSGGDRKVAIAKFGEVIGFRLLDEGDLLEFWPMCAQANGWLFQIKANGWFDLEASRPGFLREPGLGVSEYFIASENGCVSVLSDEAPKVEIYTI